MAEDLMAGKVKMPGLLTIAEFHAVLCQKLGRKVTSVNTIYRWVNDGVITAVRVRCRWYVPLPEVMAVIRKILDGDRF